MEVEQLQFSVASCAIGRCRCAPTLHFRLNRAFSINTRERVPVSGCSGTPSSELSATLDGMKNAGVS